MPPSYCLRSATRRSDKDAGRRTRWAELTLHEARGLQGRRDDRAGGNARLRVGGCRRGKLRNRETCGLEGGRDHDIGVEREMRLSVFTPRRQNFGRTVRAFGDCSSDGKGAVSWNLSGY